MRVVQVSRGASDHLNMIRGVAALAVLFDHDRSLFLTTYGQIDHPARLTSAIYFATGLGSQSVIVFFVLSGFFVARSALKMAGEWSWRRYLSNRFSRLYLVLLPALILTALMDQLSLRMPGGTQYFYRPIPHLNAVPFVSNISAVTFVGNAFFLQTILVPIFGSNTPLWSLANEFWYYLLFPLLLLAVCPGSGFRRFCYGGSAAFILVWLPFNIRIYFLIWLVGAFVNVVPGLIVDRHIARLSIAVSLVALLLTLALSRFQRVSGLASDFCVGITFAAFLYCLLLRFPTRESTAVTGGRVRYGKIAAAMAGCSYSIYAIHMPLLVFFRTSARRKPWDPDPQYIATGLALGAFVICAGYVFSRVTEARTSQVRGLIEGRSATCKSDGLSAGNVRAAGAKV